MNKWHTISIDNSGNVIVKFNVSNNRFWNPDEIRDNPIPASGIAGRDAVLSGPGSNWMYAHTAIVLRTAGVKNIEVNTAHKPGNSDDLQDSYCKLHIAQNDHSPVALLMVQLSSAPALSPKAINELINPRIDELSKLSPLELAIYGKATNEIYTRVALVGLESGAKRITCWSARDGWVVIYDSQENQIGSMANPPSWLINIMPRPLRSVVIGVTGDPNRGKSVFSSVLDWYRQRSGVLGWKLDCDGQSPTPPWFLSMMDLKTEKIAREMREVNKRPWNPEMEGEIARQLRLSRKGFEVLIADLPGGNHKVKPAERIPAGRECIFAEVDAFILLDGKESPSEDLWRESLRPHGLESRITIVLKSSAPESPPSLTVNKVGSIWQGEITGLDRSRTVEELGNSFRPGLDLIWTIMVDSGQRSVRDD